MDYALLVYCTYTDILQMRHDDIFAVNPVDSNNDSYRSQHHTLLSSQAPPSVQSIYDMERGVSSDFCPVRSVVPRYSSRCACPVLLHTYIQETKTTEKKIRCVVPSMIQKAS